MESNGAWKGGRTYHKKGYVKVRDPEHPRASRGYVFEHILVIEAALARFLEPDESVHHRNGVRGDNRLENLELWVIPQPCGIRVSDAVVWAQQILERHGPFVVVAAGPDSLQASVPALGLDGFGGAGYRTRVRSRVP